MSGPYEPRLDRLAIVDHAEPDDGGVYIYEREIPGPEGTSWTKDLNVSALLQPGDRVTHDPELLVMEAAIEADGKDLANPAKPANAEIANLAMKRIMNAGHQPAWKGRGGPDV